MAKIPITIDHGAEGNETKMVEVDGNSKKSKQKPNVTVTQTSAKSAVKEDIANIASYLFTDVFVPMMKDIIYRIGMGALGMGLYGVDKAKDTPYRSNDRERYSRISHEQRRDRDDLPQRSRGRYDFSRIEFKTREEAQDVLDFLRDELSENDDVSVATFYSCINIRSEYTDRSYGWVSLRNAEVIPTRNGFILDLPKPVLLED